MGLLLIVEDQPELARSFARMLQNHGQVVCAPTVCQALSIIEDTPLLAALIDEGLPDGSGLDLVAYLRRRWPAVPILVMTALTDLTLVNRAQALRAEFVFKPVGPANVLPFVEHAIATAGGATKRLELAVRGLVASANLSRRDQEVLNLALAGVPRTAMAAELDVSENTLKTTIRRLLDRTGEETLQELVRRVYDVALRVGPGG